MKNKLIYILVLTVFLTTFSFSSCSSKPSDSTDGTTASNTTSNKPIQTGFADPAPPIFPKTEELLRIIPEKVVGYEKVKRKSDGVENKYIFIKAKADKNYYSADYPEGDVIVKVLYETVDFNIDPQHVADVILGMDSLVICTGVDEYNIFDHGDIYDSASFDKKADIEVGSNFCYFGLDDLFFPIRNGVVDYEWYDEMIREPYFSGSGPLKSRFNHLVWGSKISDISINQGDSMEIFEQKIAHLIETEMIGRRGYAE